ncbi:hypothetical protein TNCV_3644251 [Trichonephila clavipes]|nr:hypothetical protein TNCV_3644251 [Trichonephila clavipes]
MEVPLRTAYGQNGRCSMQPKPSSLRAQAQLKHELKLELVEEKQKLLDIRIGEKRERERCASRPSVCLSRRRLPPVRITSIELLLSPRQLCRSACRRETLLGSGISENHSEPSLDCTVGGQSVPIQKI